MTQTGSGGIFRPYAIGIGTAIAIVAVGFMARSPVANHSPFHALPSIRSLFCWRLPLQPRCPRT